ADVAAPMLRFDTLETGSRPNIEETYARRLRSFSEVTTALLDRLGNRPSLVVLDDVHWGAHAFHEYVSFFIDEIGRRGRPLRLLLVILTRVLPPPHPVAHLLAELERRARVHRLDLGPLDDASVSRIVQAEAGAVPTSAYHELARRSARGNPLRAKAAVQLL